MDLPEFFRVETRQDNKMAAYASMASIDSHVSSVASRSSGAGSGDVSSNYITKAASSSSVHSGLSSNSGMSSDTAANAKGQASAEQRQKPLAYHEVANKPLVVCAD